MLETAIRARAVADPKPARGPALALAVAVVALATVWSLRSWEWSLVDDADYRLALLNAQEVHGWFGGMWQRAVDTYSADKQGGQFRPLLYVYAPLFYLLDVGPAHVVRLLMFLTALLAPPIWLARANGRSVITGHSAALALWALFLLMAIPGFYEGLEFLSIMELTAMVFAGLGFLDRNDGRRILWFACAAGSKSPMLVLLLAFALVLAFRRRLILAVVSGGLGLAVLGVAAIFARGGYYTSRYSLNTANISATVGAVAHQAWLPAIVVLTGLLLISPRALRLSEQSITFALGSLGYLTFMLPWGSQSGYNLAPPVYLGACAAIALVAPAVARGGAPVPRLRLIVALVVAALPAIHGAEVGINGVLRRDTTVRDTVRWLADVPRDNKVATNGLESAARFQSMLLLRGHTEWNSERLFYVKPGSALGCQADYLIELDDQGASAVPDVGNVVRRFPMGRVFEIEQPPTCP